MEESQSISEDISSQQTDEQAFIDEEKDTAKENVEVSANVTDVSTNVTNIVSTNITKVNCSSEKIYGPVEVCKRHKIILREREREKEKK